MCSQFHWEASVQCQARAVGWKNERSAITRTAFLASRIENLATVRTLHARSVI